MEKSRGWRLIFQKEKKIWEGGGQDPELLAMEGKSGARGECKKNTIGRAIPLSNVPPSFTRGWIREIYRVFQKVSFHPRLLAHAMRHEVTRYSIPADQFGGKRSNLSRLKSQLTSDRLAVAPTTSVDLLACNKYRDGYLSKIL